MKSKITVAFVWKSLQGYSTSETWYAVLDYGTNYCNLRNLIEGETSAQHAHNIETTSEKIPVLQPQTS